jgi:hypothetical protein
VSGKPAQGDDDVMDAALRPPGGATRLPTDISKSGKQKKRAQIASQFKAWDMEITLETG